MSESSQTPEPFYTQVQLSGPPEAVNRLMAALSGAGEVIFDHRSAPDVRGDVQCTAEVVTYGTPGPQAMSGPQAVSGRAEAIVQSTLQLDTGRWPGLGQDEGSRRLEDGTAAALAAVEGVQGASSRLVAVMPAAAAR
ncbi:hypothetical protein ACIF8T_38370 [Streptomyces sp. NPDC085946]|uniref:hypothetical protein n=1 Tax=Streptomyces sp. NPDC085946 TaxID=3365744 RepID=UPI0037D47230